jgi:hypothetical protein
MVSVVILVSFTYKTLFFTLAGGPALEGRGLTLLGLLPLPPPPLLKPPPLLLPRVPPRPPPRKPLEALLLLAA